MTTEASRSDPIADLQSRLVDLEQSKAHDDAAAALRRERAEMLLSLRKIKEAMKEEAGGGGGASNKELERLRAENEALKKANAKQRYRIEHLVYNLRESLEERGDKQ
mmetsp:Transcript_26608/g.56618  ORF Transcript_26608/g.56618 Transcript_26608/m.56618 type:complete len:107 (-) Transcript_26608:281-601(-)